MPQQFRVTRKVDFTGATQIGVGDGFTNRGTVYYVLGGETGVLGSDTYDGKSWDYAKATIDGALTAIAANPTNDQVWNTIVVGVNTSATYLEGDTLTMNKMGTKLFGAMTSGQTWGVPSIHTHGTETLLHINAHACEVGFIGFHDQGAGNAIEVGYDTNTWRTHIHDCYFGGNNSGLYAIIMGNYNGSGVGGGSTIDAPCTVVERCHINSFVTGAIYMASGYGSVVRDCTIQVYTAAYGINYANDTTSRPWAYILNNWFNSIDGTNAVGINMVNTPTAGYLFIDGNRFVNFADDAHCIELRDGYVGLNYNDATAIASA